MACLYMLLNVYGRLKFENTPIIHFRSPKPMLNDPKKEPDPPWHTGWHTLCENFAKLLIITFSNAPYHLSSTKTWVPDIIIWSHAELNFIQWVKISSRSQNPIGKDRINKLDVTKSKSTMNPCENLQWFNIKIFTKF